MGGGLRGKETAGEYFLISLRPGARSAAGASPLSCGVESYKNNSSRLNLFRIVEVVFGVQCSFGARARERVSEKREREKVCACVRVLMLFVTESPLQSSRIRERREEERRRRADLSTSHCGTRGAAAGDSKPTAILDCRV